jgi:hypothetical protein
VSHSGSHRFVGLCKISANRLFLAQILRVGSVYDEADQSAELMLEIFPELDESTDLFFTVPSKKALRRFPALNPLPPRLDPSMRAHRILDDRIRWAVTEAADAALQKVPSLTIDLETKLTSRHLAADSRFLEAVMSSRGIVNKYAARRVIICEILLKGKRRQSSLAVRETHPRAFVQNEKGAKSTAYPGTNFWDDGETASSNQIAVQPIHRETHPRSFGQNEKRAKSKVFPGTNFWEDGETASSNSTTWHLSRSGT